MAGNCQHRLAVAFGIIESIQKMNPTGTRRSHADAETPSVLGIAAGGERRGLFVPHLNKFDFLLARPQRLEKTIYTVTREAENGIDAPADQPLEHEVGYCFCHGIFSLLPGSSVSAFGGNQSSCHRESSVSRRFSLAEITVGSLLTQASCKRNAFFSLAPT